MNAKIEARAIAARLREDISEEANGYRRQSLKLAADALEDFATALAAKAVDAQTEARALADDLRKRASNETIVHHWHAKAAEAIATALSERDATIAAKDTELAVARQNFEELAELQKATLRRAERAQAENKRLERDLARKHEELPFTETD